MGVVWSTTRGVQLAWMILFVMYTLQLVCPSIKFDGQIKKEEEGEEKEEGKSEEGGEESKTEEARLLQSIGSWEFQAVDAAWPQRELFRPQSASCMPNGELLVGTPYETYAAKRHSAFGLTLEALPRSQFPAGTSTICTSATSHERSCLLAAVTSKGIALWTYGTERAGAETVVLPVEGSRDWLKVAGAMIACKDVEEMLPTLALGASREEWCLMLAGWDRDRIPVAVVPLQRGPSSLPNVGTTITPSFDAPIQLLRGVPGRHAALPHTNSIEVLSLHIHAKTGRLWALFKDDLVQGWDLLQVKTLGRWRLDRAMFQADFQLAAVCETVEDNGLLVVGRSLVDGAAAYQSALPQGLVIS